MRQQVASRLKNRVRTSRTCLCGAEPILYVSGPFHKSKSGVCICVCDCVCPRIQVTQGDKPLESHHWSTVTVMAPEVIMGRWLKASGACAWGRPWVAAYACGVCLCVWWWWWWWWW